MNNQRVRPIPERGLRSAANSECLRGSYALQITSNVAQCRELKSVLFGTRHSLWKLKLGASLVLGAWILVLSAHAQYSIDWFKVSGGGGTSTNGQYSVSGTIAQPDGGGAMSGGAYSVTGGFWSLISVVQTPGLPNLTITHSGNSVIVSWPNTGSYSLQQNANITSANGWATSSYSIITANGTNSITIAPPTGSLFFRLKQ